MKLFPFFLLIIFFSSSVDSTEIATFKISYVIDNSLEFDKFIDKLDALKNKMQNELLAPILRTIDKVIRKIGEERTYDYIFDAVQGSIVYALDSHNLTADVLEELSKATGAVTE